VITAPATASLELARHRLAKLQVFPPPRALPFAWRVVEAGDTLATMPVSLMTDASPLSDPSGTTPPSLEAMSGRANSVKPLTERSYEIVKRALAKLNQGPKHKVTQGPNVNLKLGLLIKKSVIPRAIAVKMADLTEAYNAQIWALLESAFAVEKDEEEPRGPEFEGVFEKSKLTAARFQEAMEEIERCFAVLREESRKAVVQVTNDIMAMSNDVPSKMMFLDAVFKKYEIAVFTGTDGAWTPTAKKTLLPLIKGQNVYRNKKSTYEFLLSYKTKQNASEVRAHQAKTQNGTLVEMLHQVQPKYEMAVFSDHTGFVAKFSTVSASAPPLYVYYHSLEHGHQHTTTRTATSYGSFNGLQFTTQGSGFDSGSSGSLVVNDPRSAYLGNLQGLLNQLFATARADHGNVLLIVGECTASIHEGILEMVVQRVQSNQAFHVIERAPLSSIRTHGTATQAAGFDIKVINASKSEIVKKQVTKGLGVHALVGYLFLNINNVAPGVAVEPSLLTLKNGTRQNLITIKYGPSGELHAFSHLLNGKEDDLADELADGAYLSVGGDLNNLTRGTALVATNDRTGSHLSSGSNSTGNKMYDKIVML
jgi:hypothetical protein